MFYAIRKWSFNISLIHSFMHSISPLKTWLKATLLATYEGSDCNHLLYLPGYKVYSQIHDGSILWFKSLPLT